MARPHAVMLAAVKAHVDDYKPPVAGWQSPCLRTAHWDYSRPVTHWLCCAAGARVSACPPL